MSAQFKPVAVPPVDDAAGLDRLLLALGKGCARYLEARVGEITGKRVNVWDGVDGLGAVLEESLHDAGVPNKRLPELLTPRMVLQEAGVVKKRRLVRMVR